MGKPGQHAKRILYVDDEPAARYAFFRRLRPRGYEVTTAGDGPEALLLLLQHDFDGIVLDIRMPGVDGFELLERIRSLAPRVPVVMLTGLTGNGALYRSIRLGCDGFVEKPYDTEELLMQIEGAMTQAFQRERVHEERERREDAWQLQSR